MCQERVRLFRRFVFVFRLLLFEFRLLQIPARIHLGIHLEKQNNMASRVFLSMSMLFMLMLLMTDTTSHSFVAAANNGLALLPPMGWSTWNTFACNVSESLVVETAQTMVASGLASLGYVYVNIDDCWMRCSNQSSDGQSCYSPEDGRNASTGKLVWDENKFPHGIPWLASQLHSMGLKLGMYTSSGPRTCSGFMGSWSNEQIDAQTFAEWGVDLVKMDCCSSNKTMKDLAYPRFGSALRATGAPIVFSCDTDELFANPILAAETGERPFEWGPSFCNYWRTGPDIKPDWFHTLLNGNLNSNWWDDTDIAPVAGPGRWNDPDMMTVGMPGELTLDQHRAQFGLWAIQSAPLIAGCDLRQMSSEVYDTLSNKDAIAINQDALATQAHRLSPFLTLQQVWTKPLWQGIFGSNPGSGAAAVFMVNAGEAAADIAVSWQQIGLQANTSATVYDCWAHEVLGVYFDSFVAFGVPANSSILVTVTPSS